jgi:hypothetical protein
MGFCNQVGPLPVDVSTTVVLYATIPFTKRLVDKIEYGFLDAVVAGLGEELRTVMSESFGATYTDDCGDNCVTYTDTAPRSWSGGTRESWFWFLQRYHLCAWFALVACIVCRV